MKKYIAAFLIIILYLSGCSKDRNGAGGGYSKKLKVLCAEPFLSNNVWQDFSYFEARNDCEIVIEMMDEPGDILKLLEEKKDSIDVDVVCGIPSSLLESVNGLELFTEVELSNRKFVDEKFYFDKENHFVPYAFSYLGFAFNGNQIPEPPVNLGELQDDRWNNMIIMPNPVSTGIGRAMLHLSAAKFGKNGFRYLWNGIQKNFVIYTESYDAAYRRLLAEEGYMMPALITHLRYHNQNSDSRNIRSVLFKEGTLRYTENAGICAESNNEILAKKFLEYLLSSEFQRRMWLHKWMYPVNKEIIEELGLAEDIAMYEKKRCKMSQKTVKEEEELWLKKIKKTLKGID